MLRGIGAAVSAAMISGLLLASPVQAGGYKDEPIGVRVDWSGLYLGVHGGGGWSKSNSDLQGPPGLVTLVDLIGIPSSSSQDLDGFLAGGHVGLQKQFGNFVFGVEASFTGGRLRGSSSEAFSDGFAVPPLGSLNWDGETSSTTRIGEIFTATGRIGYAWDRWLGYVKGGYASGKVSTASQTGVDVTGCAFGLCLPLGSGGGSTNSDARHNGWVAGAGFEYMINPNVTFGIEYNYIDLGAKTHNGISTISVTGVGSGTFDSRTRVDVDAIHAVYARLSVKVDGFGLGW